MYPLRGNEPLHVGSSSRSLKRYMFATPSQGGLRGKDRKGERSRARGPRTGVGRAVGPGTEPRRGADAASPTRPAPLEPPAGGAPQVATLTRVGAGVGLGGETPSAPRQRRDRKRRLTVIMVSFPFPGRLPHRPPGCRGVLPAVRTRSRRPPASRNRVCGRAGCGPVPVRTL